MATRSKKQFHYERRWRVELKVEIKESPQFGDIEHLVAGLLDPTGEIIHFTITQHDVYVDDTPKETEENAESSSKS